MALASEFYAPARWTDRWGSMVGRPSPHKGLDIGAASRQVIPIHRSGRVVNVSRSDSVGGYFTLQAFDSGEFDTYCHIIPGVSVDVIYYRDQTAGWAAGYNDDHGSAWTGPHLHLCRSTSIGGWATWGPWNLNPEEVLLAMLGGGGSATPGNDRIGGDDMSFILHRINSNKTYHVIPARGRIVSLGTDEGSRVKALQTGAVAIMQQNDPNFVHYLQVTGFGEVAANLGLIDSLPFLGAYQQT